MRSLQKPGDIESLKKLKTMENIIETLSFIRFSWRPGDLEISANGLSLSMAMAMVSVPSLYFVAARL